MKKFEVKPETLLKLSEGFSSFNFHTPDFAFGDIITTIRKNRQLL